jgi:hypothetical protein
MPRTIKTAVEVQTSTEKLQKTLTKERREYLRLRTELEAYQDLRDEVCALVRNSSLSWEDIHARCGPHPSTLKAWDEKTVFKPQLGKMRSTLRILGYDFGIIERPVAQIVPLKESAA